MCCKLRRDCNCKMYKNETGCCSLAWLQQSLLGFTQHTQAPA